MICTQCSTEVPAGSAFCPKCGRQTAAGGAAPLPQTPAQAVQQRLATAGAGDTEQELWRGGFSPKAMLGYWLMAAILTVAGIAVAVVFPQVEIWIGVATVVGVVWIFALGYLIYERLSVDYTLTTQRFIHKTGILRRVTNRIEAIDIDDVTFEQGLIERLTGVGTIKILSTDLSHPKLLLRGIDDVQRIANVIDTTRRDERRKRGLHIEAV